MIIVVVVVIVYTEQMVDIYIKWPGGSRPFLVETELGL